MSKKQDILLVKPPLSVPSVYKKDLKVEDYNRDDNLVSCPDYRTAMPRKITQSECDRRRRIELGIEDEHLARLARGIVEQDAEYEIAEGEDEKLCRRGNPNHSKSDGKFTDAKSAGSWSVANVGGKDNCKWGQTRVSGGSRRWLPAKAIPCGRKRDASGRPINNTKSGYRCYDGSKISNEAIMSDEDRIVDLVLDRLVSMGVIEMQGDHSVGNDTNIRQSLQGATQADLNKHPDAKIVYESLVRLTGVDLLQEDSSKIDKCKQYSSDCFNWNSCFTSALRVVALSVASSKGKDFFGND
jgi:hypothetical protein